MTKPRKALKSLFSRTEPEVPSVESVSAPEAIEPAHNPDASLAVKAVEAFEATSSVGTPEMVVVEAAPVVVEAAPVVVEAAPVVVEAAPVVVEAAPVAFEAPLSAAAPESENLPSEAQEAAPLESMAQALPLKEVEPSDTAEVPPPVVATASEITFRERGDGEPVALEPAMAPEVIADLPIATMPESLPASPSPEEANLSETTVRMASPEPVPVPSEPASTEAQSSLVPPAPACETRQLAQEHHVHKANVAAAVLRVQYNFEVAKEERETWGQREYVDFIRRIDVAQAEAFFLKGKLLCEVKDRFFQENKVGWKEFSESVLGLNYTTANQYIRVSLEFDVTSHRRPDFGFEHYKALLPLKTEERAKLMSELPQVSVKELRSIVQRKLQEESGAEAPRAQKSTLGKEMIDILVNLKERIQRCARADFSQTERWQLTAACRNLAEDLESLAAELNEPARRQTETRTLGASAYSEA